MQIGAVDCVCVVITDTIIVSLPPINICLSFERSEMMSWKNEIHIGGTDLICVVSSLLEPPARATKLGNANFTSSLPNTYNTLAFTSPHPPPPPFWHL